MNLNWMLERAARSRPRKPAIISDLATYSYSELLDGSRRAAAVFRDQGVGPGDRVGLMMYNTPAFAVAAFGLWRAGATLVPINHKFTSHEIGYVASHAGLTMMITDVELAERARAAVAETCVLTTSDDGTGEFDRLVVEAEGWDGVEVDGEAVAQVLYTSGTTSSPKGCLHTHAALANVPAYTTAAVGLRDDDRFLIAMPIWHASPLNNWFLSIIFLGGTVVLLKEYEPRKFLQAVQEHAVTAFFGAPIAYLAPLKVLPLAGLSMADFDVSSVRLWAYGGAPMGPETISLLKSSYGDDRFCQVYGMSEMGPVGAALSPAEHAHKAGSIGAGGMPGVDIRVVDSEGVDVPPGGVGEIWMRSASRMCGYLSDPVATAAAFVGDWYRTGDLARLDADGYLFVVDRLKDVVITGGENVYCPEVEDALRAHPLVSDAAVIGRDHPEWGQTVVAVVEATGELTLDAVRDFLADKVARYKIPRQLMIRDALPRNPSGKVMKHVLRAEAEH